MHGNTIKTRANTSKLNQQDSNKYSNPRQLQEAHREIIQNQVNTARKKEEKKIS